MPDRLAIVILNWNGHLLLEQFLPSVVQYSQLPGVSIWIADNHSTDNSLSWVKENFPEINIVQNGSNLGYAGGYNTALAQIDAEIYCLLNSDVEVTPGWLEPVLAYMDTQPSCAACQPKLRSYEQRTYFEYAGASGGMIDRWGYPFCRGRIFDDCEEDTGQYDDTKAVFWASGAALFIRKEAYLLAGGLDDRFFAHMEEIDLCWRLQRLGYHIAVVPASLVYHLGGGTLQKNNPRKVFLNFHNSKAMLAKNLPILPFLKAWFFRELLDEIAMMRELSRGHVSIVWAIFKAQVAFLLTFFRWRSAYRNFESTKRKHTVGNEDIKGIYDRSIVWAYYKNKIRYYTSLPDKP
jgi:GT2 family glycosyltransferase